MNNLLQLKGTFEQENRPPNFGPTTLPANKTVSADHLEKLRENLIELKNFWEQEKICNGALISAYYNKIAAKSNRIIWLLSDGKIKANNTIVGARFTGEDNPKHIITHYVQMGVIDVSISQLTLCINALKKDFDGIMTVAKNENINDDLPRYIDKHKV